jgi:hypothetical protein
VLDVEQGSSYIDLILSTPDRVVLEEINLTVDVIMAISMTGGIG